MLNGVRPASKSTKLVTYVESMREEVDDEEDISDHSLAADNG